MKFYDRVSELGELKRIQALSFADHSRMTVITGRRRIGKTSLAVEATRGDVPTLYLFVSRKNEAALCAEFSALAVSALGCFVPPQIASFGVLFRVLMEFGKTRKFNLIIDEFQQFLSVNPAVYSDIQNIWDQCRQSSHVNLILMGSVFSLMNRIFQGYKEPLFGRADNILKLRGFGTATLKEIMTDFRPGYSNDELLALYSFTGGVPKYVELLCENTDLSIQGVTGFMVRDNSSFTDEGKNLLIEEFGRDYGVYFSVLSCIAAGINTQPAIEASLGGMSLGGHLRRLVEDYSLISRHRPILAKPRSQNVRYEIDDNFLKFWFRYFDRNQSIVEIRNFDVLRKIVEDDYPTFTGLMLERYFRLKMVESCRYRDIAGWWERGGSENEIDIVALSVEEGKAEAVEVKRQRKNFSPARLAEKISHLKAKALPRYDISGYCLSLDDM